MNPKKEETPIHKKIAENEKFLKDSMGIGKSFDVGVRKLKILNKEIQIYYCTGLCDSGFIIHLLAELMDMDAEFGSSSRAKDVIKNHLAHQQVQTAKNLDEVMDRVLSGLIAVLIDGSDEAFIVDVRSYPGRSPEEPDVEKVVRGSRDGYTENIVENTALTRRRVRDERLRHEIMQVGDRSKTDVCIAYLQDVADPTLVDTIRRELSEIRIDGVPMADKTIEEFLVHQGWNPFPLVRYTERPDVAATHILEGHVLLFVDTSPSVIIMPTTLFHHVQHAEEYRQTPMIGAFLRWIRFGGMLASVVLLPLWLLFSQNEHLLPKELAFIGPDKHSNIPLFLQIIFAELGVDVLRMAAIHTPSALSTAMGLIAAVLIGQIAIDVGLFVSEVILYVSLAAIGSFATPSYELSVANKMVRIFLILAVTIFHVPGFVIGLTLVILYLSRIQNMNTPYLWPFIPFNPQALFQVLVRVSVPLSRVRPSIVRPKDNKKQADAG